MIKLREGDLVRKRDQVNSSPLRVTRAFTEYAEVASAGCYFHSELEIVARPVRVGDRIVIANDAAKVDHEVTGIDLNDRMWELGGGTALPFHNADYWRHTNGLRVEEPARPPAV